MAFVLEPNSRSHVLVISDILVNDVTKLQALCVTSVIATLKEFASAQRLNSAVFATWATLELVVKLDFWTKLLHLLVDFSVN